MPDSSFNDLVRCGPAAVLLLFAVVYLWRALQKERGEQRELVEAMKRYLNAISKQNNVIPEDAEVQAQTQQGQSKSRSA